MADQEKEQSYYKSGKKISFDDIARLTHGVITGQDEGIIPYVKEVMETAMDRRTRTPIHRLNKNAMSALNRGVPYVGARYPRVTAKDQSNSAIFLNPQALNFSGRPLDAEWIQKVLDHEMWHEFQGNNPELTENIAKYMKKVGGSPELGYISAGKALVRNGYDQDLFDIEAQAHLGSKTMPDRPDWYSYTNNVIPKVIESPLRFKNRNMQVNDPRVAEEFQRTVYPILPKQMQQRFKSSFPSDVSPEMPKGFAQSALDSFMSIIGLGAK